MSTATGQDCWVLEVVRGREVGRRYLLPAGEATLGNALAGASGLDLADQEANSPRRMAARQACLAAKGESLTIRDLESPGGTFVNRQRLLEGQVRPLQAGDLIQVGSVQLEVKRAADSRSQARPIQQPQIQQAPPTRTTSANGPVAAAGGQPGSLAFPFTLTGGATCRSWDDFLTLAAQRWALVRDELTSGRLAEHLRKVQRMDLLPRIDPAQTPDDQLDAWLGGLPVSRSSAPELEVHPDALVVRSATLGGSIKQTLRISNIGYRLLRGSIKAEPVGTCQIRVTTAFPAGEFVTIDQTDLLVEIDLPDRSSSGLLGRIAIESNGGTRRVEVRLERPSSTDHAPGPGPVTESGTIPSQLIAYGRPLRERLAALPLARRLWMAPVALVMTRLLVMLAGFFPLPPGSSSASQAEPRLGAIAVIMAVAGLAFGAGRAARGGELREIVPGGFAGALIGMFLGTVAFAVIQSGESVLGSWSHSAVAVLLLWAFLGFALAGLSWLILPRIEPDPPTSQRPESTP
jgi:hypothetical protein